MNSRGNILVVTQWSFKDALIQAYTLPYLKIISSCLPEGNKIYLVTFEQERLKMTNSEKKIVEDQLKNDNIHLIDFSYSGFGIISIIKYLSALIYLLVFIPLNRIKTLHSWGSPAGALAYMLSLITGRRLILDSYEPHAEAMVENNTWKAGGIKYRLLFFFEKKMSAHASIFIAATAGMKEYALKKYNVSPKDFHVKPACTDLTIFSPEKRKNKELLTSLSLNEKIICVYAGKFGGIYLTDEVFAFFRQAEKFWGDKFAALILTPTPQKELAEMAARNGFDKNKMVIRFVPHNEIADYMGMGDFAITPVKPIPTKKYCTPIKDGEYWGLGLPVVITKNISDDSDIIEKYNAGAILKDLNEEGYNNANIKIDQLLKDSESVKRISEIAKRYRSFDIAKAIYRDIYGS